VTDTGRVTLSRRAAALLVLAGGWPLLIWPNFVRVVATDERAFDDDRVGGREGMGGTEKGEFRDGEEAGGREGRRREKGEGR
jgi:hypothetical protein